MLTTREVCAHLADAWSLIGLIKKVTAKMSSDGQSYTIRMTVCGGALKKSGAIKRALLAACNDEAYSNMIIQDGFKLVRGSSVVNIWDQSGKCTLSPVKITQSCVGNGSPAQTVFSVTVYRAQPAAASGEILMRHARYNIKASQREGTPGGNFLSFLYYQTGAIDLLKREERSGYPHNGGEHTLIFHIAPEFTIEDVETFLDVVEEQYYSHPGCSDFVTQVRAKLH